MWFVIATRLRSPYLFLIKVIGEKGTPQSRRFCNSQTTFMLNSQTSQYLAQSI